MHYRAILNRGSHFEVFERGLRILKHGDPVGNQRIVGLFYYINWLNCLSYASNDVIFPLKPSRKFATK